MTNEELLPPQNHGLCCRNPEPQPPFRVSTTHYPNDLEACILDKTGEAVLWTDHRIIQSVCDYLNTRTRLSDSKDWEPPLESDCLPGPAAKCGCVVCDAGHLHACSIHRRLSDEAARVKAEKVVADVFGIESGLDIAPEFYKPLVDRITALLKGEE